MFRHEVTSLAGKIDRGAAKFGVENRRASGEIRRTRIHWGNEFGRPVGVECLPFPLLKDVGLGRPDVLSRMIMAGDLGNVSSS